jgi:hypothetical protein
MFVKSLIVLVCGLIGSGYYYDIDIRNYYIHTYNIDIRNEKLCNMIYGKTMQNITMDSLDSRVNGMLNIITRCFTLYERSTGDRMITTFDNFAFEIIKGSFRRRFYQAPFERILFSKAPPGF